MTMFNSFMFHLLNESQKNKRMSLNLNSVRLFIESNRIMNQYFHTQAYLVWIEPNWIEESWFKLPLLSYNLNLSDWSNKIIWKPFDQILRGK